MNEKIALALLQAGVPGLDTVLGGAQGRTACRQ